MQEPGQLGETEVAGRPYGQGGCVLAVHMDSQHALPPLDLALLQVLLSAVVCVIVVPVAIITVPLHYSSALKCKILSFNALNYRDIGVSPGISSESIAMWQLIGRPNSCPGGQTD